MGVDGADPIITTASARANSTWLAEFCADGDGRLLGSGMIDPRDVDGACREARRCVEELGFVSVFLRPNPVLGRTWHDRIYEPLWSTIAALDIVVAFHEGGAVEFPQAGTDRFLEHGLWHLCTHPTEQQMAMISMVMGGVLERNPSLRAAFLECGAGWLPYWLWRMDEGFEAERQSEFSHLTRRPSEYIRAQCYVSIDSDEETGVAALELLEGSHVVWGSDYPHPDGKFPMAYKTLSSLPGVTADRLRHIVQDNPIEMFGPRIRSAVDARRR